VKAERISVFPGSIHELDQGRPVVGETGALVPVTGDMSSQAAVKLEKLGTAVLAARLGCSGSTVLRPLEIWLRCWAARVGDEDRVSTSILN
jgi:hypothetical protein